MAQQQQLKKISRDFQAFLDRIGTGAPQSQTDREALFREFLQWRAARWTETVMPPPSPSRTLQRQP